MSYLHDKVRCKGGCGLLYDADLLDANDHCRDCISDAIELKHLLRDDMRDGTFANEPESMTARMMAAEASERRERGD